MFLFGVATVSNAQHYESWHSIILYAPTGTIDFIYTVRVLRLMH